MNKCLVTGYDYVQCTCFLVKKNGNALRTENISVVS